MSKKVLSNVNLSTIPATYSEKGFISPLNICDAKQTMEIRRDFEAAELELEGDPERLSLLKKYPNQLLPSFSNLTRNNTLIEAASAVLGPDLLVWSASLFIKEKNSSKIVSWHQDLTYWGLDDIEETTCWFAISKANKASGCMKFVPGTHKTKIVPHTDTYAENNMLTRGQEIAVNVNEEEAVFAELEAGQASMHHGLIFHSSGPNTTSDRRIGSAIRYIKPSMKQNTGDRSLVSLVSGKDHFGNFKVAEPPKGRLLDEDFELCREDHELKKQLLF